MKIEALVEANKKKTTVSSRDFEAYALQTQALYEKASSTQHFADIKLPNRNCGLVPLGDLHLGGRGVDYRQFRTITDEIVGTPDLYTILIGDLVEFAIKLRSVAEVCAQIVGPDKQVQWIESWLDEIKHKVIAATWCNHAIEREEKQAGVSLIKRLLSERFVMFDTIGHADIHVGKQVYKIAVSHKFRGSSYLNAPHAGQRYMRFQGTDREIAIMGDIHTPGYNLYWDGPVKRLSLVGGTLNTGSAYAQRYFSLFTQPVYPCIELSHKEHSFVPFENLATWKNHRGK